MGKKKKKKSEVVGEGEVGFFSLRTAAKMLGVSYTFMDRRVRDGRVPVVRMGSKRMIPWKDMKRYLREGIK